MKAKNDLFFFSKKNQLINFSKFAKNIFLLFIIFFFIMISMPAWGVYSNPLYLSGVPGTVLGALIWGGEGNSHYGDAVTSVGDVNGDGFDDVLIAGERVRVGANFYAGEAILFYGTNGMFGSSMVFNLFSDIITASQGVRFLGTIANQRVGRSIAGAGDVNGDGYNDFLIGSDENSGKGTVYLIYGKGPLVNSTAYFSLNASVLNGTNGVAIVGNTDDNIAYSNQISGAGDVNGDGYDDILVAGDNKVYLIYGSVAGIGSAGLLDLAGLDASQGVMLFGSGSIQSLGTSVSGAGDVNGDGYDDILLGAFKVYLAPSSTDDTGGGVLLYGSANGIGTNGSFEVSETTLNDTNGTRFIGPSPMGSGAGNSVSGLGDVNGDGYADFVIGAPNWGYWTTSPNQGNGRVYLVYGDSGPLGSDGAYFMINLDGSNGVKLNGPTNYVYAGRRLTSAGDVNGDGLADIVIPAYYEDSQAGRTYVLYGKQGTVHTGPDFDLGSIFTQYGTRMIGANLYGARERSGSDVSTAGDFNGDGKSDLFIGASEANNPNGGSFGCGKAYLVWGDGFPESAVVKDFTKPGDAPKSGIGMTGDGKHTYPLSRVWIDYDDGSATGAASLETVTFYRSTPSGSALPGKIAYGYWQVTTNRTGWSEATLTLKYSLSDIGLMDKNKLYIYQSDSASGPFTQLNTISNPINHTLSAKVSELSYFVIGESDTPPSPDSDFDGLADNIEVDSCTDPNDADTDDDGIKDGDEDKNRNGIIDAGETNPCAADTDGDGIQDGTELGVTQPVPDPDGATGPLLGTDTNVFQPDMDPATETDPLKADTDGDGVKDGDEDKNHNGQVDEDESDPLVKDAMSASPTFFPLKSKDGKTTIIYIE